MDNYKFGNALCSLREERNLTQRELAKILDVSDKAISKWENGQAIPRMETLEKIAETFDTTVEELIAISKDNLKRVLIINDFGTVLHFQTDDEIISLQMGEEKWVILDNTKERYNVTVYGELSLYEIINDCEEPAGFKDKIVHKGMKALSKWTDKQLKQATLNTKCSYILSNVCNEQKISVENEIFSIGDKMWIDKNLVFLYPKLVGEFEARLTHAECINKTDAFVDFKKRALTSELGISIPLMLLAYPFRKMYFRSILKPKGLMKYISKADYYVQKNQKDIEKREKRRHPILKTIGIITLLIIAFFAIDIGTGILNVETDKPVLVSQDFSSIQYFREEYVRIDELPKDTVTNKKMGVEFWTDARIDGYSKSDQYFGDNKVTEFIDKEGNIYLWFVPNYIETITDENGEYKEYDDFTEHYVYALKK